MADPISAMAIGSIIATGVGVGVQAYGAEQTGKAQANMFNYQAGVAQANTLLAKQDAAYATQAEEVSAQESGMKTRFQVGETRAGFGAGNVAGGSVNAVEKSETEIGAQNQALIRANAAKRAYGFGVEAAKDTAQGQIYQSAAVTSRQAGDISALSTIIGGAGQVAGKWMMYGQYFPVMGSGVPGADNPELALA